MHKRMVVTASITVADVMACRSNNELTAWGESVSQ